MPNENSPEPISPGRYALGAALTLGYHAAACAAVHAAATFAPRWRPVAAWHRRYLLDTATGILRRERIRVDRREGFSTGLERR